MPKIHLVDTDKDAVLLAPLTNLQSELSSVKNHNACPISKLFFYPRTRNYLQK